MPSCDGGRPPTVTLICGRGGVRAFHQSGMRTTTPAASSAGTSFAGALDALEHLGVLRTGALWSSLATILEQRPRSPSCSIAFGFDTIDAGPLKEGWRIQRDPPGYI